jgi:hypothetical protein
MRTKRAEFSERQKCEVFDGETQIPIDGPCQPDAL